MLDKKYKISAIVIGNGESRASINLNSVTGIKIGCNAIHRDFNVDYLIAVDQRCVDEAINSNNTKHTKILTRPEWAINYTDPRIKTVPKFPWTINARPDEPTHWGSGPYAVLLGATVSDKIELIGFDLWGVEQQINNVYKGTANYNDADSHAVDPSYWIYQISKIFEHYSYKYFTVYNVKGWKMPESWKLANVEFKTLDTLINNV